MTSGSGIIFRGLMEEAGLDTAVSFSNSAVIFVASVIFSLLLIAGFPLHPQNQPEYRRPASALKSPSPSPPSRKPPST